MSDLRHTLSLMQAGRWNEAHDRIQHDDSMLAAWLHGLLHLQEGDLEDAENWYNRAARHFRSRGSLAQELALFEAALPPLTAHGADEQGLSAQEQPAVQVPPASNSSVLSDRGT